MNNGLEMKIGMRLALLQKKKKTLERFWGIIVMMMRKRIRIYRDCEEYRDTQKVNINLLTCMDLCW